MRPDSIGTLVADSENPHPADFISITQDERGAVMSSVERWVEKFKNFGAQPSPSRYVALFAPERTVFDSGMERPLKVAEMAPHMEGILKLMPDLHITVSRWRAQADTVFVEAQNTATLAGQKTIWDAVYCVTLRGPISTRSIQAGRRTGETVPQCTASRSL